jgi:hypothetical protein
MVHPFTFFLVNDVTKAYELACDNETAKSVTALYYLALSLDKKGQAALKTAIKEMEGVLFQKQGLTRELFTRLYRTVMEELHEENYFIMAKMVEPKYQSRPRLGSKEKEPDGAE